MSADVDLCERCEDRAAKQAARSHPLDLDALMADEQERVDKMLEWVDTGWHEHLAKMMAEVDEWVPPPKPDPGKRRTDAELLADLRAAAAGD